VLVKLLEANLANLPDVFVRLLADIRASVKLPYNATRVENSLALTMM